MTPQAGLFDNDPQFSTAPRARKATQERDARGRFVRSVAPSDPLRLAQELDGLTLHDGEAAVGRVEVTGARETIEYQRPQPEWQRELYGTAAFQRWCRIVHAALRDEELQPQSHREHRGGRSNAS